MQPTLDDKDGTLMKTLKKHWNDECDECKTLLKELKGDTQSIRVSLSEIWLHAWKYECKEWSYQVPKPYWAEKGFKYENYDNSKHDIKNGREKDNDTITMKKVVQEKQSNMQHDGTGNSCDNTEYIM